MLYNLLDEVLSTPQKEYINWNSKFTDKVIFALDLAMINGSWSISSPYYAKQNPEVFRNITYALSEIGVCKSSVSKNFAKLDIVESFIYSHLDKDEVTAYRINNRIDNYLLKLDTDEPIVNLTKTCYGIKDTGLVRRGFAKCAKVAFKLDTKYLSQYLEPIVHNAVKGILKSIAKGTIDKDQLMANEANYFAVARYVVENYIANPDRSYNLGQNISDSRGRSSYTHLSKLLNPVSSKDGRACITLVNGRFIRTTDTEALNDIYYFIAELTGSKATSETAKVFAGRMAYKRRTLPTLDLTTDHGRKELHELIWLDRIYNKLDKLFSSKFGGILWDIVIEIDQGASIMQYAGAYTNYQPLLERTNAYGDTITDPWFIPGVPRTSGKAVFTPVFYGSAQAPIKLLKDKGIKPTVAELTAINKEYEKGTFSVIALLKDALIQNTNVTTPWVQVTIGDETFGVPVNKFKRVATGEVDITNAYDTASHKFRYAITHKVESVPDYDAFKTFVATLLIHNSDSQDFNAVAEEFANVITIHDAVLTLPGQGKDIRVFVANRLNNCRLNRNTILNNFRKSLGINGRKADIAFMKLYQATKDHQLAEDETLNATCMK